MDRNTPRMGAQGWDREDVNLTVSPIYTRNSIRQTGTRYRRRFEV